jgi:DNA-binding winged helix-turn-helix (wHTH) protein
MDSLITAAARALHAGDPLGALNRIALRKDAPALALRGIAMAQIGDFARARELVRKAARAFGAREVVARARCIVAEAELSLASRDLGWPPKKLEDACNALEKHGDRLNAAHARYLGIRRLLLIGRLDDADARLIDIDRTALTPALQATHELIVAGIAIRRIRTRLARAALARATDAARIAGIPALAAEVVAAARVLDAPAARWISRGESRVVTLEEVEATFASKALVFDDCRYAVRAGDQVIALAGRAVLFTLARVLAEAWPGDVSRDELIRRVFRLRVADETLRARLRVEIGRLRRALKPVAGIEATQTGFVLRTDARQVIVLARPMEEEHAAVLAFLADGESWPTSSLALALGTSQRSVQRALDELAAQGKVQAYGAGRSRRWMTPPLPGIATTLLLPAPLPGT